jgi:oligopeptide transport system ATP-binding protein
MVEKTLEIHDLKVYYFTSYGTVRAVDGVTFDVNKGETLGLVGESGCGKSTVALSIMRLVQNPGRVVGGEILFEGEDLLKKNEEEIRQIRGNKIAVCYQDPRTYMNPVYNTGYQIMEVILQHKKVTKSEAKKRALEILKMVGIPSPSEIMQSFPHQLSGGMRQRAMIAMALSCQPDLLIADEPTTEVDVIIQAQILDLLNNLKKKLRASALLITHDFRVVAELSDKVAVMYAGNLMEWATNDTILRDPKHPYTKGLLDSLPDIHSRGERLNIIGGSVPNMVNLPSGCKFHPRCPNAMEICCKKKPEIQELKRDHYVACHLYNKT